MAGSIALSLTQRYDKTTHLPLDGGQATFYAAGTTTPQSAYQDISLTIPWPNPLTLDSGGNVPQLFFADGYIKFRLSNSVGVTQIEADFVLVLGPTSGAGAAPSVDATTILATGDLKVKYGTGTLTGFVRSNGRTIGSASSGASERANSDSQSLFEYLWNADANLAVSTGRGGSANADWVANKTIALPDWRGRTISGLDDMGNSAASRLTSGYFGSTATVLGASGGGENWILSVAQLPTITPAFTGTPTSYPSSESNIAVNETHTNVQLTFTGTNASIPVNGGISPKIDTTVTPAGTIAPFGSGSPHRTLPPMMLATIYLKL